MDQLDLCDDGSGAAGRSAPKTAGTLAKGAAWLVAAGWLWLLAAVPCLTDAACDLFAGLLLTLGWLVLALAWLALGMPWRSHTRASRLRWLAAGVALCLGAVLGVTDAGLAARVALSRPWLDAYASRVPPDASDTQHEPRRVGLFVVDGTESIDGVVLLYTSEGFLDRHGIALVPPGQEGVRLPRRYTRPLLGHWHSFRWKF